MLSYYFRSCACWNVLHRRGINIAGVRSSTDSLTHRSTANGKADSIERNQDEASEDGTKALMAGTLPVEVGPASETCR
jgi:hypothetical protein